MALPLWIQLASIHRLQSHDDNLADLAVVQLEEVNVTAGLLEHLRGALEAQLITLFEVAVVDAVQLLHGVVRQVDERLVDRLLADGELLRARAYVALCEHVAPLVRQVSLVDKHPQTDIELATVDEQRPLDVLLNDEDLGADVRAECRRRLTLVHGLRSTGAVLNLASRGVARNLGMYVEMMLFVCQDLAARIMDVEVQLAARRELLDQLPKLLERVEQANTSATVEVVRLDEPHVGAVIHLCIEGELSRDDILVLGLSVDMLACLNQPVDLRQCALVTAVVWLLTNALDRVEVGTEAVDLVREVLRGHVEDELDRKVLEHVQLVLLAVSMHVCVQLVLGADEVVALQVVDELLLAVGTELLEVDEARDRRPLEAVQGEVLLLELKPVLPRLQHSLDQLVIVAADERVAEVAVVCQRRLVLLRHLVVLGNDLLLAAQHFKVLLVELAHHALVHLSPGRIVAAGITSTLFAQPHERLEPIAVVVLCRTLDAVLNVVRVPLAFH